MENRVPETLGGRIKAVRAALGMTQEEFCSGVDGVSRANLSNAEVDRVKPSKLVLLKICERHHTTMDYLLEGKLPMFPERTESDQIIDFANELIGPNADPFMRRLVLALIKLEPSERAALRRLSDEIHAQEQGK